MRINNNLMAMNTHRQYSFNAGNSARSTEKLSSGYRINRASDDAAGLAISEKMRGQIRGLNMASKNSEDAISLLQTAEGALSETTAVLQRMRELSVQAASDTNDSTIDRAALDAEYQLLLDEVDDIASKTTFNGKLLLDGSVGRAAAVAATGLAAGVTATADATAASGTIAIATISDWDVGPPATATIGGQAVTEGDASVTLAAGVTLDLSGLDAADWASQNALNTALFGSPSGSASLTVTSALPGLTIHTGANEGDTMLITVGDMTADGLAVSGSDIKTQTAASQAIDTVGGAITAVSAQRGKLGALQNRLEHKINNLDASSENLQASESRIRDIDMAGEMTRYTKNNILLQAATSMLAQANQAPQNVLSLIK